MDGGFGNDVGVEAVAEIDRVDVVTRREGQLLEDLKGTVQRIVELSRRFVRQDHTAVQLGEIVTYHSRSLYMMVKKTWRNRLTALINTASR